LREKNADIICFEKMFEQLVIKKMNVSKRIINEEMEEEGK